jgi:transposase
LEREEEGEVVICVDEKTGIQALERAAPSLPMEPGKPERQEYNYKRHGTLSLIAAFEVCAGAIILGCLGKTRKSEDFLNFIKNLDSQLLESSKIRIILDNLNTHCSEELVRFIAQKEGINQDCLGKKGKSGILQSMETRRKFLNNKNHRIIFHYTPKHASWLNQIEIWFSILVKKLLRYNSFSSTDELKEKIFDFIAYFNKTMAKPFKWTYKGKLLIV